jgi:predicted nucleotidyltransferase
MKPEFKEITKLKLKEISEIILDYFKDKSVDAIYLFGSAARNEVREESDIDIAIVGSYDFMKLLGFKSDLEDKLKKNVDLVDFNKVDTSFQGEIVSTGIAIYARDSLFLEELEMKILSMYLTLEEDREIVFKEILLRGSVFNWKE